MRLIFYDYWFSVWFDLLFTAAPFNCEKMPAMMVLWEAHAATVFKQFICSRIYPSPFVAHIAFAIHFKWENRVEGDYFGSCCDVRSDILPRVLVFRLTRHHFLTPQSKMVLRILMYFQLPWCNLTYCRRVKRLAMPPPSAAAFAIYSMLVQQNVH